ADRALWTDLHLGSGQPLHAARSAAAVENAALAGAAHHRVGGSRHCSQPAEDQRPAADRRGLRRRARLLLPLYPAARRPLLERPGRPERRVGEAAPRNLADRCPHLRPLGAELATSGSRWDFFPPGPTTRLPMFPASASATKLSGRENLHHTIPPPPLWGRVGVGGWNQSFEAESLPSGRTRASSF